MSPKVLVLALLLSPIAATGSAMAAEQLADAQLDRVTAAGVGAPNPLVIGSVPNISLPPITCDSCVTETTGTPLLEYTGGFTGLLQAYYQRLLDLNYTIPSS